VIPTTRRINYPFPCFLPFCLPTSSQLKISPSGSLSRNILETPSSKGCSPRRVHKHISYNGDTNSNVIFNRRLIYSSDYLIRMLLNDTAKVIFRSMDKTAIMHTETEKIFWYIARQQQVLRGYSPRANYTNRATATCRRN
jgi:hypothetical protein